jgi:uncharacterized membrane protein YcaP (DUF421 family)
MYLMLFVIVRMGKKRFLGTPFDVILVVMIGSIAARALTEVRPTFQPRLAMLYSSLCIG